MAERLQFRPQPNAESNIIPGVDRYGLVPTDQTVVNAGDVGSFGSSCIVALPTTKTKRLSFIIYLHMRVIL